MTSSSRSSISFDALLKPSRLVNRFLADNIIFCLPLAVRTQVDYWKNFRLHAERVIHAVSAALMFYGNAYIIESIREKSKQCNYFHIFTIFSSLTSKFVHKIDTAFNIRIRIA